MKFLRVPSLNLNGCKLKYVEKFKYLGHIINDKFNDNDDIDRERQRLCISGNMLVRNFNFCWQEIKTFLFKTYVYSMYCSALWSNFHSENMRRLKVCYNTIMRKLAGVPPWHSARQMFVDLNVRSFEEQLRVAAYSFMKRLDTVPNSILYVILCSDARVGSHMNSRWNNLLR